MKIRFLKPHNNNPAGKVISINDNRGERLIGLGIAEKTTAKETDVVEEKEKAEGSPVTEKRQIKAASEKKKK